MKLETVRVCIPGLRRSYTFLHTSDCHLAHAEPFEGEQAAAFAQKETDFWSYSRFSPKEAFDRVLQLVKEEKPDGLFLCGDVLDYYSKGNLLYLRKRLSECGAELFYVCGNHERPRDDAERDFYGAYKGLMPSTPGLWVKEFDEFRIAGVDNGDKCIRTEELEQMQKLLAEEKPMLLLMHMPMLTSAIEEPVKQKWGEDGGRYFLIGEPYDPENTRAFCDLLCQPKASVAAIFAGHIHLSHDGEFAPGKMQHVSAPSFEGTIRRVIVSGE